MSPEELTRWTIRLALCGYVVRVVAGLVANRGCVAERIARWAWTAGCLLLWAHVACAFQFQHHWSHRAAYEQTARETAETVGIDWGGGIYFNYLLMGVWTADALWWWVSERTYRARAAWWNYLIQTYFAFMIFNATVIFESGPLRWAGLAATAIIALLWLWSALRGDAKPPCPGESPRSTSIALCLILLPSAVLGQERTAPRAPQSEAAGWPHLRGPHYDAHSDETGLADAWPAQGPPVLWTRDLGQGYSGFVAAGERVFTQMQTLYGQYVVCLNGDTGATIWEHRYGWPYERAGLYPGPRATPTLHEGKVYFAGTDGTVGCLQAETGQAIWSIDIAQRFQGRGTDFGYSCSPLVEDGKVILPVGGKGASVVALDARDGSTVWQTGDEPASYCSALPMTLQGRRCIVAFLQNALAVFDLKSGKLLWQQIFSDGYDEHAAYPLYSEPFLMIAVPFKGGATLYRFEVPEPGKGRQAENANELNASVVWQSAKLSNDVASSVLVEGAVYGFDLRDPQSKLHRPSRGAFRCLDLKTAKVHWSSDSIGHASILVADGKLILFNDHGELILARANSRVYQELARTQVFSNETCWTTPALHRGRLYLRTHTRAACLFLGKSEQLNPAQARDARSTSEIAGSKSIDLTHLLGGEREHPFVRPDARELGLWYAFSLFGVFGVAAVLAGTVYLLRRLVKQSPPLRSSLVVFWSAAFLFSVIATPLYNRLWPEYIFTWPATLFVAFQAALISIVWAEAQTDRKRSRWVSRIAVVLLLAVCGAYFHLCGKLSMGHEWVFLIGFMPAFPIAVPAARRLLWSTGALVQMLWFALSFTAYFWSCAAYCLWQSAM